MNKLILVICILTISLTSCGQGNKKFNFQDIGLHIKIPNSYLIQDKFPKPAFSDKDGNPIKDATKLKDLEADLMKGLLIVSSPDQKNTVSFNIIQRTSKTGNFEEYFYFSKSMQEFLAEKQMTNYDTASSVLTIDNVRFQKFSTTSKKTNAFQYSGIYLAEIKSYFLVIKADYVDNEFGAEMEKAILGSKFN